MADVNRRRRVAVTVLAGGVGAAGLALAEPFGYTGLTGLAFVIGLGPQAVSLPFALAGVGRWVCMTATVLALALETLLIAYGSWLFMPGTLVLGAAALLPDRDEGGVRPRRAG